MNDEKKIPCPKSAIVDAPVVANLRREIDALRSGAITPPLIHMGISERTRWITLANVCIDGFTRDVEIAIPNISEIVALPNHRCLVCMTSGKTYEVDMRTCELVCYIADVEEHRIGDLVDLRRFPDAMKATLRPEDAGYDEQLHAVASARCGSPTNAN